MGPIGRRDLQHTFGHIECPACESLRLNLLSGGGIAPGDSFTAAATAWLELRSLAGNLDHARRVSPRTLRDDRQYVRTLAAFFDNIRLDQVHAGHLVQYQIERSQRAGPGKVNQELAALQRILRCAGLWGGELRQNFRRMGVPYRDVPRAMSPEEQQRFLEAAGSRKCWELLYWYSLVALHTTCRGCEMRGLHMADVNFYEEVLQVRAAHAKTSSSVRTIYLSADAKWALDRIYQRARGLGALNPQDYIFPFCLGPGLWDPRRPMSETGIRRSFDAVRQLAGVPWLRIHDLRHSSITRMAEAGVPIATIMAMAGHLSPAMSQHYTQVSEQAKRKAVVDTFSSHPVRMRPQALPAAAKGAR